MRLFKKKLDIPLQDEHELVKVRFIGEGKLRLSQIDNDGVVTPVAYGENIMCFKFKTDNVHQLRFEATEGVVYMEEKRRQRTEPVNDDPVPEKVRKQTLLGQIKEQVRKNRALIGEPFDREDFPSYEMEDDEEAIFEEEQIEQARMARHNVESADDSTERDQDGAGDAESTQGEGVKNEA